MIGGAALAALSAAPAFAADQPTSTVQEVVVTGSRIPHPGLTSVSPLTTVGSQDIKLQGVQNVEDLINSLPQAMADFGAMESNGATGTATVDLRGLGDKRTLVLIDGKRLQPGDPGLPVADLNFIPAALIDRVDIVTGGASAVYGSDAVAGVVNFIMKKDFEGLRIDVQYGFDQHDQHSSQARHDVTNTNSIHGANVTLPTGSVTDGARVTTTITGGANSADGNGNVTFYFNYQHTDPVLEAKRDWSACSTQTASSTFQFCGGSSTSFPGRFNAGAGSKTLTSSGSAIPYTSAAAYNFAPLNYLQRPDQRYTAGEFSHYQINPHLDIYSSFMFMHDNSDAQIAGSGAFYGTPYQINCNNPQLTTDEQNAFCAGHQGQNFLQNILIGRRDVEGVGRVADLDHFDYRYVLGARGEITDGWNYDVYAQYGSTSLVSQQLGFFSISKTNQALDVIAGPGGVPECADPNARAAGCVPWNIWNNPAYPGGVTAQQLKYLETTAISTGLTTEQVVNANVTGDLSKYGVKSPWAKDGVGVSLGTEYRRESLGFSFDGEFTSGDLAGLGGAPQPVSGAYDVKEIFGEVRVPIIQDMPLAKEISFEGGYRYSNYSISGGVSTYKEALDWQVTPDIRLRGSFQRAVRAPNVIELFAPSAPGLASGTDPCAATAAGAAGKAAFTLAQCVNTGVTAAQYGNGQLAPGLGGNVGGTDIIPQCISSQCNIVGSGNLALKPEASNTKSVGFVFTPTFIPGFNLTVDWFDIKVSGAIGTAGLTTVLSTCANDPTALAFGGSTYCSLIHRDTSALNPGALFGNGFVNLPLLNANELRTTGVDMEANYRVNLSDWGMGDHGSLVFNMVGTYTQRLYTAEPGGSAFDCSGLYGTTCGTPTAKWRHKLRVTWVTPWNVSLSAQWRYISGTSLDLNQSNPAFQGGPGTDLFPQDAHIPAYSYLDLSGEWRVRDRITLHAGVNNVFDKDPPILDSNAFGISAPAFGNGNTYPQVYDSLGRTIFVGITADF
jgi:outer membrane receptor protein involved in Fe transport